MFASIKLMGLRGHSVLELLLTGAERDDPGRCGFNGFKPGAYKASGSAAGQGLQIQEASALRGWPAAAQAVPGLMQRSSFESFEFCFSDSGGDATSTTGRTLTLLFAVASGLEPRCGCCGQPMTARSHASAGGLVETMCSCDDDARDLPNLTVYTRRTRGRLLLCTFWCSAHVGSVEDRSSLCLEYLRVT